MIPVRLSGEEFAGVLGAGEIHERMVASGRPVVVVDGDDLPDALAERSMESLQTLAAVVVGAVGDPTDRTPQWADVVVGRESQDLESVLETVGQNTMASTALAVLLRTGQGRSVPGGLVAESTAYGLLQGGPEFGRWRARNPARVRPKESGAVVEVSRQESELSITLDRPHVLNAFNAQMRDELLAAIQVAAADPTITSVSLRGAGGSFCSGGDLDEFGSRPDPVSAHLVRLQRNVGRAMAGVADRTTVHLHGSTVGSGIELAAFAHRVVAKHSTRISLPEVRLGLIPGAGGTVSLPRRIGRHATLLLALGLPAIDAGTALDWGLVDELEA
ncbi:MAG: enoyl-CoA hydratase/isomerase family protein [Acidimicrobiales bacterium]